MLGVDRWHTVLYLVILILSSVACICIGELFGRNIWRHTAVIREAVSMGVSQGGTIGHMLLRLHNIVHRL